MSNLNETSITQAVSFLKDARVVSTPVTRKIDFLKNKKLSTLEIAEAFKRAYPQSEEYKDILSGKIGGANTSNNNGNSGGNSGVDVGGGVTSYPVVNQGNVGTNNSGNNGQPQIIMVPYPPQQTPVVEKQVQKKKMGWGEWLGKWMVPVGGLAALGALGYSGKQYMDTSHDVLLSKLQSMPISSESIESSKSSVPTPEPVARNHYSTENNFSSELGDVRYELGTLATLMRQQAAELKVAIDQFKESNNTLVSILKDRPNETASLKADVNLMKSFMTSMQPPVVNPPFSTEKVQPLVAEPQPEVSKVVGESFIVSALNELIAWDPTIVNSDVKASDELTYALNTLIAYLKNIVNFPTNSIYRRVVLSNPRFKRCLLHYPGCENFLLAAGFVNSSSALEWTPDDDKDVSNSSSFKLIQFALKSVENAKVAENSKSAAALVISASNASSTPAKAVLTPVTNSISTPGNPNNVPLFRSNDDTKKEDSITNENLPVSDKEVKSSQDNSST